jgi:outer membrane receptor for ferrienterochelin and colicins
LAEGLKPEKSNSFSGSVDWAFSLGHWQGNLLVEGFYTDLRNVFVLEVIGHDEQGNMLQERRNGSGARIFGGNLDLKIAHGKDIALQLGFTAQRSRYKELEYWSENPDVAPTKNMWRTPDYYGYFTLSGSPFKNFDWSLSAVYTGKMYVPHFAPDFAEIPENYPYQYIETDVLERTPAFFDLNAKVAYAFILGDHLKLQVNAGVQNILNQFQRDLDQGGFRDSGYFYGPTSPRTFFIGLKFYN